jgi:hypothetical protein
MVTIIIIGLLGASLFLGPYNLFDDLYGEKYYYNILSNNGTRIHLFGNDSEIRSFNYLGNQLYSLETTNNKKYILEITKPGLDYPKFSISIFEYFPAAAANHPRN